MTDEEEQKFEEELMDEVAMDIASRLSDDKRTIKKWAILTERIEGLTPSSATKALKYAIMKTRERTEQRTAKQFLQMLYSGNHPLERALAGILEAQPGSPAMVKALQAAQKAYEKYESVKERWLEENSQPAEDEESETVLE